MTRSLSIEGGELEIAQADAAGVRAFKGVPYAAPPVGALRWRTPAPVVPWTGVRRADAYGANAIQGIVFADIDPSKPGVSEDCLFLNVWTPAAPGGAERLPVMVWIHGGGFAVGSAGEPRYDGGRLAARGIVVVTVNYRLNAFGFLAHPELTAESGRGASGNWGLFDLLEALRWVARNIAAFGGDPAAVAIAGESAGSEAVSALMASPLARGLFARAIGQSGAMFASPSRAPEDLAEAEVGGLAFARRAGATSLRAMRAAPAEAILAAAPGLGFRPIVDGHLLPRAPAEIFARGEQSDVPLLAGWNKDEGFNFTLVQGENAGRAYPDLARALLGADAQAALALYPAGGPETDKASARALGGDLTIIHPTWAWIEAHTATGRAEIFRFRFERAPLTPDGWFGDAPSREAGAFHAGEIPYVFDNLDLMPWLCDAADRAVAATASAYWVNFVRTGDPNGAGLPRWPRWRAAPALAMAIDAPSRPAADDARARHAFLARIVAARSAARG